MAKAFIILFEPELDTLHQLSQQENQPVKSQTTLTIRNEPKRFGLIEGLLVSGDKQTELSAETNNRDEEC